MSRDAPERLQRVFEKWSAAGRPPAAPSSWDRRLWEAAGVPVPAALPDAPIDRVTATEWAGRVAADGPRSQREAFVVAMIWGHGPVPYGPFRTARVMRQPGFDDQLVEVTDVVLRDGGVAGYALIRNRRWPADTPNPNYLKYLGPAFGTKYLYFLTKAYHPQNVTPILDDVVRRWFRQHMPDINVEVGQWGYPSRYQSYVETTQRWGSQLGLDADDVEHLIFVDQQAGDGGRLDEGWLSGPLMSADQLLAQLSLALVARNAGDAAAVHLTALQELLDTTDDLGPPE